MPNHHDRPRLLSFFALLVLLFTNQVNAEAADWAIDPEHFSIVFGAEHAGYQQQMGMFLEGSGSFNYDPETRQLNSGRVEIEAASLFTNHEDRDDHLKGRDFLNVRRNPLIVFESTGFTSEEGADGVVTGTLSGNLTLIGETNPVDLMVTINKQARYPFGHRKETLGISAHTTINRSEWGMNYGVSNNLVGDAVTLRFEFEGIRQ